MENMVDLGTHLRDLSEALRYPLPAPGTPLNDWTPEEFQGVMRAWCREGSPTWIDLVKQLEREGV